MERKKFYHSPELEVVEIKTTNLLTASFNSQTQTTDPIDDPEDIL